MTKAGGREERLLAEAGSILGLAPDRVLFETGYRPSNRDRRRLAAAMAELRAVVFLKEEGFGSVRLVPPSNRPTADISASRGGVTYAFEVRCVGEAGRTPAALAVKYRKKLSQAAASRKRGAAVRCGVIFVLDPEETGPGPDPAGAAAAAHSAAGARERDHVCVLSGGAAGVWPPWGA